MLAAADIESISLFEVRKNAFKRGIFDFITDSEKGRHEKQEQALRILTDNETEELLYGGAAGGAKSWTGCTWLLFQCENYPGTRWFIGREELKRITESTLITFFKVAQAYGCNTFKYNGQKHYIQFANGSRIDMLDLSFKPSDPLYERFGSTEYTGGYIEEGGEVNFGAYDVLNTRIGRHMNDFYGLIGKLFISCNPKKNWLYSTFYKPHKAKSLPTHQKFLQAFVQDNPFIETGYVERLRRTKDKAKKERLLHGNWEYDDNPYALCDYDAICAMFENDHVEGGNRYITADIARFGSDKAIIFVWEGWKVIDCKIFEISKTTEIQAAINMLRQKYGIPKDRCLADEDGVGGGVVDNCGIKGFVNNGKPLKEHVTSQAQETPNYANLQTQCAFKVSDVINERGIYIACDLSPQHREEIKEDLSQLIRDKVDDDRKLYIKPKSEIKEDTGRSPDWRDVILMRYWFELKPSFVLV